MGTLENNNTFMTALEWKNKGITVPVFGKDVFVIDTKENEQCLVILHGYPTSSYDFYKVIPELSKHYRVIVHDLIGFGFSHKTENKYFSIADQVDYALELWRVLGLQNITILGHDFGTEIAQEILAREKTYSLPINIQKVIFSNGSMPTNHLNFIDTDKELKRNISKVLITMLSSYGFYKKIIKESFAEPNKISEKELEEMWYLLSYNEGRELLNFVENYIHERKILWDRWIRAVKETEIPMELITCKKDNFTNTHLQSLCEDSSYGKSILAIENSGHYPMLESPKEWINCILKN